VIGLKFASPVLGPILRGGFFAIVAFPAVAALRRRGLPNWAAITVTCVCAVGVLVLVGLLLYSSLSQFAENLPTYQAQSAERTESIKCWLADHGVDASGTLDLSGFTGSALAKLASKLVGAILNFLSPFLLLLLLTVFFLVDASLFSVMGERQLATSGRWPAVASSLHDLQRFLVIKSLENAIITPGLVLLCVLFDVPFPLLWG
jgi:predicted PurR-regulated permease PerM